MENSKTTIELPNMMYYFISGSLPHEYGGLTKSLLLRSKLFGQMGDKPSFFLTYQFDIELRDKIEKLYQKERIDPKHTAVVNLYDNYLSDISVGKRIYTEKINIKKLKKQGPANKLITKFNDIFSNQKFNYEIEYFETSTKVHFVNYRDESNILHKREEYRKDGTLGAVSYYNQGANHPYLTEFINNDNIVYLDKLFMYDVKLKEYKSANIIWYSDNGVINFKNESHMRRNWLEFLQSSSNEPKLFLVDSRHQDRHLFNVKKKTNSYYACIIHSKHYENSKQELKSSYYQLMEHRLKLDALFFITKEQKNDVEVLTGNQSNYFYTPHTLENELSNDILNVTRQLQSAVIISRFSGIKNITDAVKAFEKVAVQIPNAVLNIYGSGSQEAAIKSKIAELNLENNIFLKGYTNDPNNEFQKASLTISTSKFEGFGLSNMEAIGNACPVVTYDYDYGAKSLIKDNENGFIVKQGDIKGLASKIIKIMQSQELQRILSKNAYESARNFTPSEYMKNWSTSLFSMIEHSNKQKGIQKKLKDVEFKLIELKQVENALQLKVLSEFDSNLSLDICLVLLDRKFKIKIASSNLLYIHKDNVFESKFFSFSIENMKLNNSNTIDYYVEISDEYGANIHKRLKVESLDSNNEYIFEGNKFNSYITTYGNYSWTLIK